MRHRCALFYPTFLILREWTGLLRARDSELLGQKGEMKISGEQMKFEREVQCPETGELVEIGGSAESWHRYPCCVQRSNEALHRNGCVEFPGAETQEMGPPGLGNWLPLPLAWTRKCQALGLQAITWQVRKPHRVLRLNFGIIVQSRIE